MEALVIEKSGHYLYKYDQQSYMHVNVLLQLYLLMFFTAKHQRILVIHIVHEVEMSYTSKISRYNYGSAGQLGAIHYTLLGLSQLVVFLIPELSFFSPKLLRLLLSSRQKIIGFQIAITYTFMHRTAVYHASV